jgi:hypothetical protein
MPAPETITVDSNGANVTPAILRLLRYEIRKKFWPNDTGTFAMQKHRLERMAELEGMRADEFGYEFYGTPVLAVEEVPESEVHFIDLERRLLGKVTNLT